LRALIVEGGWTRGALAAARGLHAAGWTVGVATPDGHGLAASSRATAYRHRVPPPSPEPADFAAAIRTAVESHSYEVVFCGGDAELVALSAIRDDLAAVVPYAPHERLVAAIEKSNLTRVAAEAGLAVPRTAEATESELRDWEPPVLIKPALHAPRPVGTTRIEAVIAHDHAEAALRAAQIRAAGGVPLVQELASGRLLAHSTVSDRDSRAVAGILQVADATWPVGVGVSARAQVVGLDRELATRVDRLLARLGWFGLANVQFVLTDEDEPVLIDLNGRFYGSLALALGAGLNLPAIWAALATDRDPPETEAATPGTRYHWLEGDLRRALRERRGGLARDLWGCFRYSRGAVHPVWSTHDPLPSLRQIARLPGRAAGRRRR
jgi:predicted ATP-grasp superfamily ATP-dependent carboligase